VRLARGELLAQRALKARAAQSAKQALLVCKEQLAQPAPREFKVMLALLAKLAPLV
jgi:hypothetical protein